MQKTGTHIDGWFLKKKMEESSVDHYDVQKEVTDKYSLRGRVFHKIREDILNGKYEEHEELKESAIGAELGVSRTPVREALRQLELEGLVSIIPNKGAYVTGITPKDMRDIYTIRSFLEGLCARWASEHITEEQLAQLEEIIYLSEYHAEKENYDQLFELDNQFHELLYRASSSKILDHVLSDFHHYVKRIRKTAIASRERSVETNREHRLIVEAIKAHDAEKAEQLAHMHIMKTIENISRHGLENMLA